MRIHPVTGMALEDGFGHLPDDQQALLIHCPYIEQTQGKDVADRMRAQIKGEIEHEEAIEEAKAVLAEESVHEGEHRE